MLPHKNSRLILVHRPKSHWLKGNPGLSESELSHITASKLDKYFPDLFQNGLVANTGITV